jgi:hypothetical protein
MNTLDRIRELAESNLAVDRRFDSVGFIDEILDLVADVGEIKCTLAGDEKLRFQVGDGPACEVPLGRARSKLRMLCARLGVVCQEHNGGPVNLYGDEATLELRSPTRDGGKRHVRFKNTMHQHEFTITAA